MSLKSLNCVLKRYQLKIKLGLSHTFVQRAPQDGAAIHCKSIIKSLFLFTVVPGERQSLSRKAGARQKIKKTKKPSSTPTSTPTITPTSTPTSTPLSSGGEIFSKILQKGSREKILLVS